MSEWINVKDRLPENEERVFIWYRYKDTKIEKAFIGEYNPFENKWFSVLDDITVLYWMPISKPLE